MRKPLTYTFEAYMLVKLGRPHLPIGGLSELRRPQRCNFGATHAMSNREDTNVHRVRHLTFGTLDRTARGRCDGAFITCGKIALQLSATLNVTDMPSLNVTDMPYKQSPLGT
jgi:hypothetical protein